MYNFVCSACQSPVPNYHYALEAEAYYTHRLLLEAFSPGARYVQKPGMFLSQAELQHKYLNFNTNHNSTPEEIGVVCRIIFKVS
jgi:hypothetical protein